MDTQPFNETCEKCGQALRPEEIWYNKAGEIVCWHCHEEEQDETEDEDDGH